MFKKITLNKIAAVAFTAAAVMVGITGMVISDMKQSEIKEKETVTVSSALPSAGLSVETMLTAVSGDTSAVDFISVTSVAQEMTSEQEEVEAAVSEAVEQIASYTETAGGYAEEYSEANEAYEKANAALSEAENILETVKQADTSALSSMYIPEVTELIDVAAEAASEAQIAAEEAKAAEEEAARQAAIEEAERKAAEEEAARQAAIEEARQEVVDYALSFVGTLPYVYGGTSLSSGVDCSGFTQAIYAHFGYSLSRSSYSQRSNGTSVSLSEIEPGDIVCYSGHVAIYIGNGQIVHAPHSGTYVSVDSIYIHNIVDIRRIIGD